MQLTTFPRKIAQSGPTLHLSPKIVQFWAAVTCSSQKLRNPFGQLAQLLPEIVQNSPSVKQATACAFKLTGTTQDPKT